MLPLMCLPTQPPADPLQMPGPAEAPAPHLFCLSPWSGPGAPSQTHSGCDGHKPEGQRLARATQPACLTAPNTNIPTAGPAGGHHSGEGSSGLAASCLWSRPL